MTLLDILRICGRSWRLLVALVLMGGAAGAAVAAFTTPVFRADTQLFISVRSAGEAASELVQGNSAAQQKVTSYVEVVQSASVLQPVIDELDLPTDVAELAERVSASSPANSVLLDISALDEDPELAVRIATAAAEHFSDVVTTDLDGTEAGAPSLVRVNTIQPAVVPDAPASPSYPQDVALGLVGGVALGLALVLLRHLLDTRVRTRDDVESVTDVPILGDIAFDATADSQPLIVHSDPRNPRAEAFRALRTNVQFIELDGVKRTFTITSALPSEGKSTTAANLALTLAETGAKVALVDADLRRPRIADMLGVEGAAGLTDLLIGRAEIEDVLVPWGHGGLRVLPAGSIPPNPSELLASEAMHRLVELLIVENDAVVIDAPPLLPVTDAAILSRLTGGALVVSASGRATRQQLRGAIESLEGIGSRALGIVTTMRRVKHGRAGGYYAYRTVADEPTPSGAKSSGRRALPASDG